MWSYVNGIGCTRDGLHNFWGPIQRLRYKGRAGLVIVIVDGGGNIKFKFSSFPKSVINFSFHPIPLTTVRTFPACRCDDWFDSARYLLRLPRCLYYQRRKAKVPPQLDFSATIKAKRRAVGGGRMMHSSPCKHFFLLHYQYVCWASIQFC